MFILKKENITFLIITLLAATVLVLVGQNYILRQNLVVLENTVKTLQYNEKIVNFAKLFISKVLKAEGEVSYDNRYKLEEAARAINNKTIYDEWRKFLDSKTQLEAQIEVKNLLELLVNKIIP